MIKSLLYKLKVVSVTNIKKNNFHYPSVELNLHIWSQMIILNMNLTYHKKAYLSNTTSEIPRWFEEEMVEIKKFNYLQIGCIVNKNNLT